MLVLALGLLVGCQNKPSTDAKVVVASIPPLAMIVRELVPDSVRVETLLPPGASPHTFELSPSMAADLEAAALVVRVGGDIDPWAERGTESWIFASSCPEESKVNPHVWVDPLLVAKALPSLSESLKKALPSEADVIARKSDEYAKALTLLDREVAQKLLFLKDKPIVVFHPSFNHFFRRYGIVVAGAVEENPGTEPSAKDMATLVDSARKKGVQLVLSEVQLPDGPAKVLAAEIGAKVAQSDPMGGTDGRSSFADWLNWNVDQWVQAGQ